MAKPMTMKTALKKAHRGEFYFVNDARCGMNEVVVTRPYAGHIKRITKYIEIKC